MKIELTVFWHKPFHSLRLNQRSSHRLTRTLLARETIHQSAQLWHFFAASCIHLSGMSRFQELIRSTPPTTCGCISLCIALFILQVILDFPITSVTLCPRLVIFNHEYYRIITSSLFHGGLLHIGMNMMSTLTISTWLEGELGTIRLFITILWSIILTSILYIFVAVLLNYSFGWADLMKQHSVGFSGVIFHLSVLESNLGARSSRSVFGIFEVPAHVYPWAL